jgi:hypothetical protein
MSLVKISGNASGTGTFEIAAPNSNTDRTLTLPDASGTVVVGASAVSAVGQIPFSTDGTSYTPTEKIVSGTVVASTSGTSINFTGIPSWVKRITVMFNGVSTNGTSFYAVRVRVGGSPVSTNYSGAAGSIYEVENIAINASTSEIPTQAIAPVAGSLMTGVLTLSKMNETGPVWAYSGTTYIPGGAVTVMSYIAGIVTLSGAVDGIQITTVTGLDTFDAGSINILYE